MKLPVYLGLLHRAEETLAGSYRQVVAGHGHEPAVHYLCMMLAGQCQDHAAALAPVVEHYGGGTAGGARMTGCPRALGDPQRCGGSAAGPARPQHAGHFVDVTWMMVKQAAAGLRDEQLLGVVADCESESAIQLDWLRTRMKQAAPQALIAAE